MRTYGTESQRLFQSFDLNQNGYLGKNEAPGLQGTTCDTFEGTLKKRGVTLEQLCDANDAIAGADHTDDGFFERLGSFFAGVGSLLVGCVTSPLTAAAAALIALGGDHDKADAPFWFFKKGDQSLRNAFEKRVDDQALIDAQNDLLETI